MSNERTFAEAEIRDLAALHAVGMLDGDDAALFEQLLASGNPVAVEEMRAFTEVAGQLGVAAGAAAPPPELEERILQEVRPKGFYQTIPGVHVLRGGTGDWIKTPFRGVAVKVLFFDPATNMQTTLLQLEPGALYPAHQHSVEEQCWVLAGDVRFGSEVFLKAGDFTYADAGTRHGTITTDGGCTLLIVSSRHDKFI